MANSYTTLKGFSSMADVDYQNIIQQNLINFFDWGFLDKGAFTNVRLSVADIRGSDRSKLYLVKDPNYTDGTVWSTFRENLVWESGLSCATQPIAISGVYINGAFKTPTTSGYQHYVDYVNGRVIFTNPIPLNSIVKMEYSYKNIKFTNLNAIPIINEAQSYSYDLTKSDYGNQSGDYGVLGRSRIQFPIVAIEMPSAKYRPLEIGNSSQFLDFDVLFNVISEDDETARKISTFISLQKDTTIFLFDLSMMAASGTFPLDYRGTPISGALTYPSLVADSVNGGYRFSKLYFGKTNLSGPNRVGTIYHSTVRITTETYTK